MTKLSNNVSRATKRVFALVSSLAVAMTGLIAGVATSAHAAPVTKPDYLTIARTANVDGSYTVHAGETLNVAIQVTAANVTSTGNKVASTDAAVTPGIAGLTYANKSYMWDFQGCPSGPPINTATATPCANATRFFATVRQDVTNSTASDVSVTTNASAAKISYDNTPLTTTDNIAYASRMPGPTELGTGFEIKAKDGYISGGLTLCLANGATSANDTLTWVVSALNGTTPVSSTESVSNPYLKVTYYAFAGPSVLTTGTTLTVASPAPTTYNLNISGDHLSAGIHHISVDLQKNGTSVLSSCNQGGGGGGGGFGMPASLLTGALGTAGKAVADATSAEKAFGPNIATSSQGRNSPDGAGGLLVMSPGANPGAWTIANISATGPNAKFAATGKVSLTTSSDAMAGSLGWYGTAAAGWAVDFWNMDGSTDIYWGTKAAAATKHLAVPSSGITAFCAANAPTGYNGGGFGGMTEFDFLNAPTTDPLMNFTCINSSTMDQKTFIVKIATTGFTKVVSTNAVTVSDAKPCSMVSTFVNPSASKTGIAALLVIADTAKSSMGMNQPQSCNGYSSAAVGNRRITTISAAGVAKVYTTNIPTAAVPADAKGVYLAPGSATGTWVGVVTGSTAKPLQTIKVSAAGVVTKMKAITLDAASVFPQTYASLVPVKQLSNGSIIAVRRASIMPTPPSMGQTTKYAIAKIDAAGKVTTGKTLTLTATGMMDMVAPDNMSRYSVTSAGVVNYYYTSKYTANGGKYKVVTWKNPTK